MTRFESSVVSYPERGAGGKNTWRGNCAPGIIKQFLLTWHVDTHGALDPKALFVDPMCGSNTSGDVAKELGVRYRGLDLHSGFDATHDDLLTTLEGERARTIWCHPPYLGLIKYSGSQWGDQPHPADLSHVGFDEALFDELMQSVVQNIARATEPGGFYAFLVGNARKNGRYYHMASHILALAPDDLEVELIKVQNNVSSASKSYNSTLVRTMHETLLVFKRGPEDSVFAMNAVTINRLKGFMNMTWRNVIVSAMRSGEAVSAKQLLERLEQHPKAQNNKDPYAKLRQVLRQHPETFDNVARGRYALVTQAA